MCTSLCMDIYFNFSHIRARPEVIWEVHIYLYNKLIFFKVVASFHIPTVMSENRSFSSSLYCPSFYFSHTSGCLVVHFRAVLICLWGVSFDKEQDIYMVLKCLTTDCLLKARKGNNICTVEQVGDAD